MAITLRSCAALAALLCFGNLTAQESATVTARLAAAKLAESRRDFATAERELRAALEEAPDQNRTQVTAVLAKFLASQGRTAEMKAMFGKPGDATTESSQEPAPAGDPIQRLITVLDSGARKNKDVEEAWGELRTLGSLAVPYLLRALPALGPFGLQNVIALLVDYDDPRIADALLARVETADPAVSAAIGNYLDRMRPSIALRVARRLATASVPPNAHGAALRVLLRQEPDADATRQTARRMAESSNDGAHQEVLSSVQACDSEWVVDLCDGLRERGAEETRAFATEVWLAKRKDVTEEQAVAAVEAVRTSERLMSLVQSVGRQHPQWARVGLIGLRVARTRQMSDMLVRYLVEEFAWEEHPEASAEELLKQRVSDSSAQQSVRDAMSRVIASRWQLSESLDQEFVEFVKAHGGRWDLLVRALPEDAEDRAIAIWSKLHGERQEFVHTVADFRRPWHRLIATHLSSCEPATISVLMVDRDWTGAPEEAVAALVAFIEREIAPAPAGYPWKWSAGAIAAFRRCPNLPVAMILPAVVASQNGAWEALIERDPAAALDYAATAANLNEQQMADCARLLPRHGRPQDVPLAARSMSRFLGGDVTARLQEFLAQHGTGNLAVIRLGLTPLMVDPMHRKPCVESAAVAARGARIEDLAEILELLPALSVECAFALLQAIAPQVRVEHAAILTQAVEHLTTQPLTRFARNSLVEPAGTELVVEKVVGMLGEIGDPIALPVLRRILGDPEVADTVASQAAHAAQKVAGTGRRQLITEMLNSPRLQVARVALHTEELRTDAELRTLAFTTILRLAAENGSRRGSDPDRFDWHGYALDEAQQAELAVAVLDSDQLKSLSPDMIRGALAVLGKVQDPSLLLHLARAASHPDHEVRLAVVDQVGNTFSPAAAPHLIEMLKDENAKVRSRAKDRLDDLANYLDERAKWEQRFKGK